MCSAKALMGQLTLISEQARAAAARRSPHSCVERALLPFTNHTLRLLELFTLMQIITAVSSPSKGSQF